MSAFTLVETTAQHIQRARAVQRQLAATSQRGRKIPDLLVAAAAEDAGLTVLHYDADFDLISAVTNQRCEWVNRPGQSTSRDLRERLARQVPRAPRHQQREGRRPHCGRSAGG